MIIGFAGRCRSGKGELAKVCERFGYERIAFANPLKNLCASILDITFDELNYLKNRKEYIGVTINEEKCELIAKETGIDIHIVREKCLGVVINDIRHMLQLIGTDLIRNHNEDWHVNKIREIVSDGLSYVIEDVRFPNEKKMIEELGGDVWFIVRKSIDNVSNHSSETSLTWHKCWDKVLINDNTLHNFTFKWEMFMENYKASVDARRRELDRILENGLKDKIETFSTLDILMIHKDLFTYTPRPSYDVKSVFMNDGGECLFVKHTDGSIEPFDNSLNIEDIKLYIR